MPVPRLAFSHCVKVKLSIEMCNVLGGQKLHFQGIKNLGCLIGRPFWWRLSEINHHYLHLKLGTGDHGGFWWPVVLLADQRHRRQHQQQAKSSGAQPGRQSSEGKGRQGEVNWLTWSAPQARSEPAGEPAFPDSQSGDGTAATSRQEWITEDVLLRQSPCVLRAGGPKWPLAEAQSSPTCSERSFG